MLNFCAASFLSASTPSSASTTFNPRTDAIPSLLQLLRDQYGAGYVEPGVVRKGGGHSNSIYGVVQSSFGAGVGGTLAAMAG